MITLKGQLLSVIDLIVLRSPSVYREASKLRSVASKNVRNPLIPNRLGWLVDNAKGESDEFSEEDMRFIGEIMADLNALHHPENTPSGYPIRVDLRIGVKQASRLAEIAEATGENHSGIIRRLIDGAQA